MNIEKQNFIFSFTVFSLLLITSWIKIDPSFNSASFIHVSAFVVIPTRRKQNHRSNKFRYSELPQNCNPSYRKQFNNTQSFNSHSILEKKITNLLICGDGDLSFSASISQVACQHNIELIASVLEDQNAHELVYARSKENQNRILNSGHEIRFGIDATNLSQHFKRGVTFFERIQFNFPHWRGKSNHKYNRMLLNDFFKSSSQFLSDYGEIHIALCEGQGGSTAASLQEWKSTWTPSLFAAEHGLVLLQVLPFKPLYNLSSHREKDRGFKIGNPKMYIFGKSNRQFKIDEVYQLCFRHEIHVSIPNELHVTLSKEQKEDENVSLDQVSSSSLLQQKAFIDGIVNGDTIKKIIQRIVPEGIRVQVPDRFIVDKKGDAWSESTIVVYLVVYCGESRALRRSEADNYRRRVEEEVEKYVALRENRKGRLVSRPFPYFLLDSIRKNQVARSCSKLQNI